MQSMDQGVSRRRGTFFEQVFLQGQGLPYEVALGAIVAQLPGVVVGSTDKKSFL